MTADTTRLRPLTGALVALVLIVFGAPWTKTSQVAWAQSGSLFVSFMSSSGTATWAGFPIPPSASAARIRSQRSSEVRVLRSAATAGAPRSRWDLRAWQAPYRE